jgi:hypothetical protein
MKRSLATVATVISALISVMAGAAWAISYAWPLDWHLAGIAHSGDLTRVNQGRGAAVTMMPVDGSKAARYGYWDAWWIRSQGGRLTLVAHAIDYEGSLTELYASPPSVVVEVAGPARARAMAFHHIPPSRPWAHRLGFMWDLDAHDAIDPVSRGAVSVRARMIGSPYWPVVLFTLSPWLIWRRVNRRSRRRG